MSQTQAWGVRHPGIGVLYYGSEEDARVAAGTAGTMLPPSRLYRLVVAAPDHGWLTLTTPRDGEDRLVLGDAWNRAAYRSAIAAELPPMRRVMALAEARPRLIDPVGGWGIHVAEDVRPTMHEIYTALVQAGVLQRYDRSCLVGEFLALGVPTGEAGGQGYLVLTLREVADG